MSEPLFKPKTIAEAFELAVKWQKKHDRVLGQLNVARARIYDFIFEGKPLPTDIETKSEMVRLETELQYVVVQRENFKKKTEFYKGLCYDLKVENEKLKTQIEIDEQLRSEPK